MEALAMNKAVLAPQTQNASLTPASLIPPRQGILQRKCACGNHTSMGGECKECAAKKGMLQRKLTIGASNDPLEQEADRVADQVMSTPLTSAINRTPPKIQRLTGQTSDGLNTAPASVERVLANPGRPLEPALRQDMEQRFGYDFAQVRVHTGSAAEESAREVNANAYTVGNNVVFGGGRYAPNTIKGKRLLAHELMHVIQQKTNTMFCQSEACTTRFTRAHNFLTFIDLMREAEMRLNAAGYTSVEDRIHILRGIYYGTPWSADFRVERSLVRNAGFQVYTASTTPDDPRQYLNCGLFEALRDSQDLIDGRRRVDVGHLIIGLDARRSWTARTVNIPTQGGTGLDISTWLGDLGGGAGMLAFRRVSNPATSAITMFRGTDFGGPINLEGDVAAFVVARDTTVTTSSPVGLTLAGTSTITDALENYLLPATSGAPSTEWNNRCRTFMQMKGAVFGPSGSLINRAAFIGLFKNQIEQFACWYLVNRLRQSNRLSLLILRAASLHISGASEEIATIFVDALNNCQSMPGSDLSATGSGPSASVIGSSSPTACNLAINALEATHATENLLRGLRERMPF